MEVIGVQRTDSQRLQQQNGPRVSFNRDVHVKRIGKRPNETTNYPIQTTNLQPPETSHLRRELPKDLSEASILREAAHVLAQAERIKCKADSSNTIIDNNNKQQQQSNNNNNKKQQLIPNKFNSLPSRKKSKTTKPISRSVSDASAKKSKKPSIFNLFSRKSDSNLSEIEEDARFKESGGRRLQRSKSDIEPSNKPQQQQQKNLRKRNLNNDNNNDDLLIPLKSTQLSPIIENTQSEDYFEKKLNYNINKDINKGSKKKDILNQQSGNIGYINHKDLDLIPSKTSISDNLKDTVAILAINHPKSYSDMHSSQLPPEKLPLTKGLTVDGMVKRLSLERFSPPPIINGPAFSYTRPNDQQIIYAQLAPDSSDEHNQNNNKMRSQSRDLETPSPYRTNFLINNNNHNNKNLNGRLGLNDRNHEIIPSHNKKSEIYINGDNNNNNNNNEFDVLRTARLQPKPISHQIQQHQSSPHHWQQLSPSRNNLSDDDEGLGFEPRKYFEEELASSPTNLADYQQFRTRAYERSKSPSFEPPIIPVIRRSVSPIIERNISRGRGDGMDSRRREIFHEHFDDEFNTLSNRRTALESKIRSRRFGLEPDHEIKTNINNNYNYSPERIINQEYRNIEYDDQHGNKSLRYLSPPETTSENFQKFHKLNTNEIQHKYSPERNHLDMISKPKKDMKSSRYVHTKYYDDGTGGVKEVYEKETRVDDKGKSHTHETRRRERLDSPSRSKDPLLGMADRYRLDCGEPKSLDSQFSDINGSSPEHTKRITTELSNRMHHHDENWQSSLKRDKRQQRSFDKGDSGIENDFRKESFNGDLKSKWRKRTYIDDIKSCELFIKRERHHTEELHLKRKKYDFIYRERSIDDGSHFDPRLDKYPKEKSLRHNKNTNEHLTSPKRKELLTNGIDTTTITSTTTTTTNNNNNNNNNIGTLKRDNKKSSSGGGGFERVKKLFSSGRKKENKDGKKDRYMVKEEEMRSRYLEYSGPEANEHKVNDISTRRRLSTPKASPLLKRIPSEKTTIITSTTTSASPETRPSPLSLKNETVTTKPEKSGWFKSLDRKSKKKQQNEKLTGSTSYRTSTDDDFSTLHSNKKSGYRPPPPLPITQHGKNLRFFGDTDIESNPPSVSRAATSSRNRPELISAATLNRNQKYSQSAYDLDRISKPSSTTNRTRSSSLQNLDDGVDEVDHHKRTKHHSRSRNLHDISESGSETEERNIKNHQHHHHPHHSSSKSKLSTSRDKNIDKNHHNRNSYEDHSFRRSNTRESRSPVRDITDPTRIEFRKPPPGPPKPARSADRGRLQSYSRERERLPDSSGTEGESSLHSQRSVVYLHATTIGAIPQPYTSSTSSRRRAMSKEDINNMKNAKQPMTRSVSRSVSMLAPWTPKHVNEGYEINYSQESQGQARPISTLPRKQYPGNGNTLSRSKKLDLSSKNNKKYLSTKDDVSSMRNSSITSASKSGISSNHRPYEKRSSSDIRRETNTIGRRRAK